MVALLSVTVATYCASSRSLRLRPSSERPSGAKTSKTAKVTTVQQTVSGWQTSPRPVLYTRVNGSEKTVTLPSDIKGKTVNVTISAGGTVTVTNAA